MTWVEPTYMRLALDMAEASKRWGEFPFGAVIVREGHVMAAVENFEKRRADVTAHAEMVAISETCRQLSRRDLSDCVMYASTEPGPMCAAAIFQSNIPRVVFALYRDDLPHLFRRRKIRIAQLADDWDYRPEIVGGVLREDALLAFAGLERPWRVKGAHHQTHHHKPAAAP